MATENNVIEVTNLKTQFYTPRGTVKAVDGVTFPIKSGHILGLVGESGCGKTVTSLSIMRLIRPPGKIVDGTILVDGIDLLKLPERKMREVRGKEISMIFQQPLSSLNPLMRTGLHIVEAIRAHTKESNREARTLAIDLLGKLGLPAPDQVMQHYPFELSVGMAQRVGIAIALSLKPKLVIADEPTSALDVTIQAQILHLIKQLVQESQVSLLYITHDLTVAAQICDEVAVMYAGKIVELTNKRDFIRSPNHPYTRALLQAMPTLRREYLSEIEGEVPDLINPPTGCRFNPRCPSRMVVCEREDPRLVGLDSTSSVACHLYNSRGES